MLRTCQAMASYVAADAPARHGVLRGSCGRAGGASLRVAPRIFEDVAADAVQFVVAANDAVVIPGLPHGRAGRSAQPIDAFGGHRFKLSDDGG